MKEINHSWIDLDNFRIGFMLILRVKTFFLASNGLIKLVYVFEI